MGHCTVRLLIFSGRPDPAWEIEEKTLSELHRIWVSLRFSRESLQVHPGRDYRGCLVLCGSGEEWLVFRNLVKLSRGDDVETRVDENRSFEQRLIASAPAEIRTPELLELLGGSIGD